MSCSDGGCEPSVAGTPGVALETELVDAAPGQALLVDRAVRLVTGHAVAGHVVDVRVDERATLVGVAAHADELAGAGPLHAASRRARRAGRGTTHRPGHRCRACGRTDARTGAPGRGGSSCTPRCRACAAGPGRSDPRCGSRGIAAVHPAVACAPLPETEESSSRPVAGRAGSGPGRSFGDLDQRGVPFGRVRGTVTVTALADRLVAGLGGRPGMRIGGEGGRHRVVALGASRERGGRRVGRIRRPGRAGAQERRQAQDAWKSERRAHLIHLSRFAAGGRRDRRPPACHSVTYRACTLSTEKSALLPWQETHASPNGAMLCRRGPPRRCCRGTTGRPPRWAATRARSRGE